MPEIRDYHRINRTVQQALAAGTSLVRLEGVENQRLLLADIQCEHESTIELMGNAGPELCFGMNAPRVTVICHGRCADGAGSGLVAGRLVIAGTVGVALGYRQRGGSLLCLGNAGARCGLRMQGGTIIVTGSTGDLLAERQSGGLIFVPSYPKHTGHARSGGRLVTNEILTSAGNLSPAEQTSLSLTVAGYESFLPLRWHALTRLRSD